MKAIIITTGNEVLKGRTVNTNFAFIGKLLTYSGYDVIKGIIIKDNLEDIKNAFTYAYNNADLIVSSGGLGPTYDDMTLKGFSMAFNLKLVLNIDALNMIKKKLNEITEEREKMAVLPEGSIPVRNDKGTAPGVYKIINNKKFIILPGVPKEVESIMNNILDEIKIKDYFYYDNSIRAENVMESKIAPLISNMMELYGNEVYIKTHPLGIENKTPGVEIEVSSSGNDKNYVINNVKKILNEIKNKINENDY